MTPLYHTVITAPPPDSACWCVVTLVHGAFEYSGRYNAFIRTLAEHGVATVSGDLPGHGRSPGRRGDIEHFDRYVDTVQYFLQIGKQTFGDHLPRVLLGHSMGGLISVLTAARQARQNAPKAVPVALQEKPATSHRTHPTVATGHVAWQAGIAAAPPKHPVDAVPTVDGLVLTSPAFATAIDISPARLWFARVLLPLAPRLYQPNQVQSERLTRNQAVIAAHRDDRLIARRITLRWYFAFRQAMEHSLSAAAAITIPTAVLQAGTDLIVDRAATRAWYERLTSPSKTYREYPGLYHELLNEPEADEVLQDIIGWLRSTFPGGWSRLPYSPPIS